MTVDAPVELSVCVCTYRRPRLLGELLDALAAVGDPPFEVVVVDNDAARSAASVVAAAALRFGARSLRCFVEPRQNIALARNLAVRSARGAWIAFIDDDELPGEGWPARLLACARRFAADAVLGPVLPRLPADSPSWIRSGSFFNRPRHATGAPVPPGELRTGNLLVRRDLVVDDGGGRFDPAYGLSGGEDTALLCALAGAGARFVWCDEACVSESIPSERATAGWLLRRSFGGGHGHARQVMQARGARAAPSLLWRGGGSVGLGVGLGLAGLALGAGARHHGMRWLCVGAAGLGKLLALANWRHEAYRL